MVNPRAEGNNYIRWYYATNEKWGGLTQEGNDCSFHTNICKYCGTPHPVYHYKFCRWSKINHCSVNCYKFDRYGVETYIKRGDICSSCRKNPTDGKYKTCKSCREYNNRYNRANKEKRQEYRRKHRKTLNKKARAFYKKNGNRLRKERARARKEKREGVKNG